MQKPLSATLNFLVKVEVFSGSNIYIQLFHFNGIEKNLFSAIKVKLLNLHIRVWKMLILEENFK